VLIADTEVRFRSPGELRRDRLRLRDRSLRPFAEGGDLDDARAKRERSLAGCLGRVSQLAEVHLRAFGATVDNLRAALA
jgi:hypothetical protein